MENNIVPFTCSGKWARCLLGHIKVAKVTSYDVKYIEGMPIKIVRQHYIETFDKDGRHIKTLEFDKNCTLIGEELYNYSDDGLLLEVIFSKKGKVTLHDIYEYSNGRVVRISSYGEDNSFRGTTIFIYDKRCNLIEHRWDSRTPENRWKWIYTYDENGNRILGSYYQGSNDKFCHQVCNTYDENGIMVDHYTKNADGTTELPKVSEKDKNGNVIHTPASRYRLESESRYNDSNDIIEKKIFDFYKERYVKNTIKYFYSVNHQIERIITLDRCGNIEEIKEISYDANHNFLTSVTYKGEDNIISHISEHEYIYYSYKELTGENIDKLFDD